MTSDHYNIKIDIDTFDALICDCYREVHSPLRKYKDIDGYWKQVPYHYGEDWESNNRELTKILNMKLGQI